MSSCLSPVTYLGVMSSFVVSTLSPGSSCLASFCGLVFHIRESWLLGEMLCLRVLLRKFKASSDLLDGAKGPVLGSFGIRW